MNEMKIEIEVEVEVGCNMCRGMAVIRKERSERKINNEREREGERVKGFKVGEV